MPSDGAYFSNSVFHDLTLVAWNGPPWELWQHGDQKTLQIGAFSFRESIVKHSEAWWDFSDNLVVKTLPSKARNMGLIPGQGTKTRGQK